MDRSFLSDPAVIAASRNFVCARLATYEDESEAAFLKGLARTRSGELENTVFTILAPDGREKLVRGARGTRQLFGGPAAMAEAMNGIATEYPAKAAGAAPLPRVADVRLAINVAAADDLPLVVVFAKDAAVRKSLEARVAALAWKPEQAGRFVYVSAEAPGSLVGGDIPLPADGVVVVQPEKFGRRGTVLAAAPAGATEARLAEVLQAGAAKFARAGKTFGSHVREGHSQGILWETRLPVTDPMEAQARERGRQRQ